MRTMAGLLVLSLASAGGSWATAAEGCAPSGDLQLICGPEAVEDLDRVGQTKWLIGSGMAEGGKGGHLRLIDTAARRWENLYPAGGPAGARDAKRFPDCTAEPEAQKFSAHGIVLRNEILNDRRRSLMDGLDVAPRMTETTARLRRALDDVDQIVATRRARRTTRKLKSTG